MSAMTSFARRSLAKNRVRTVVAALGIMLSVALICAILTCVSSLQGALEQRTAATEGTWHAYVIAPEDGAAQANGNGKDAVGASSDATADAAADAGGTAASGIDALAASDDVTDIVSSQELAAAPFSEADADQYGSMVVLTTLPETVKGDAVYDASAQAADESAGQDGGSSGAFDAEAQQTSSDDPYLVMMPAVDEGRMPQAAGEIALPDYLRGAVLGSDGTGNVRSDDALEIGGTIELDAGHYTISQSALEESKLDAPGSSSPENEGAAAQQNASPDGPVSLCAYDAQLLIDEARYAADGTDASSSDASAEPKLADAQTRAYTVVGFYESQASFRGDNFTAVASGGACGIVAPEEVQAFPEDGRFESIWLVTQNLGSTDDITSLVNSAFHDEAGIVTHNNLLRAQGIHAEGALIWNSLYMYAAVLLVVIAAASVSLIYNAFAISVAERTRQFGLLASIGASKRQIRRAVLAEALMIGVVAVPLGIVAGLAGTAAVLALTRDAFTAMLRMEGGIPLVVDPATIAVSVALSVAVLLVSAWIPARRAARVSAVDAIRQTQDVKPSRRAERKAARAARKGSAQKAAATLDARRGISGALFGTPGVLARRSMARSGGRGRVVVASLAVSTALVVIAGSVAIYLDPLVDRSSMKSLEGTDVVVSAFESGSGDAPSFADTLEEVERTVSQTEGASVIGEVLQGQAEAVIPAGMITPQTHDVVSEQHDQTSDDWVPDPFGKDGSYAGSAVIFYVDDATWNGLVSDLGLDAAAFNDPDNPRAIGIGSYQATLPVTGEYVDTTGLAATGQIDLYGVGDIEGRSSMGVMFGEDGDLVAGFVPHTGISSESEIETYPLDEMAAHKTIEVGAIVDDVPPLLNSTSATTHFPAIILPRSVAESDSAMQAPAAGSQTSDGLDVMPGEGLFSYYFAVIALAADDHAGVAAALEDELSDLSGTTAMVSDVTESADNMRLVTDALKLFILCFTVITMLVAVANVFNTLANSIILRTREFAVLRSVGMGNRAFARMLACECASYAVRGLVIGLVCAFVANWALYQATSRSFVGISFTMPWAYVGVACALVLAVLGASVAYALHRSHAMNIVEALRAEAL